MVKIPCLWTLDTCLRIPDEKTESWLLLHKDRSVKLTNYIKFSTESQACAEHPSCRSATDTPTGQDQLVPTLLSRDHESADQ